MTAVAFWLAFISATPVFYWILSILFDFLCVKLFTTHYLKLEFTDASGTVRSEVVKVSSDAELYRVALSAIRSGKKVTLINPFSFPACK